MCIILKLYYSTHQYFWHLILESVSALFLFSGTQLTVLFHSHQSHQLCSWSGDIST